MAFTEIFPSKPAKVAVPVRIGMSKMRGGARARMVLLIERDVLRKLGGKAERYRIHVGSVEHKHEIMLVQDDQGPFEANVAGQKSTIMRVRLPPVEQFPDCKIAAEPAKFEYGMTHKGSLVVTLPAWAWNPQARMVREKAGRVQA